MDATRILDLVSQAFQAAELSEVTNVSYDNDHKSGELIFEVQEDGEDAQFFMIRSADVEEITGDPA